MYEEYNIDITDYMYSGYQLIKLVKFEDKHIVIFHLIDHISIEIISAKNCSDLEWIRQHNPKNISKEDLLTLLSYYEAFVFHTEIRYFYDENDYPSIKKLLEISQIC